ncbi:hypothetical protein M0805_009815 [Coniferiporia weirii]|nr:hypothetical protein M0805_009815 [Coniferiporia weirii]
MAENLHAVTSAAQFQALLSADLTRVSLLFFWAAWAEPCAAMHTVVGEVARAHAKALVLTVEADAEALADVAETFEVASVPTFVLLRGHTLLSRIEGADAERVRAEVALHTRERPAAGLARTDRAPAAANEDVEVLGEDEKETAGQLEARCRKLMEQAKVVLFMKGTPDAPRCGFSRQTVALFREHGVEFSYFDILTDERVRSGLKVVNNWPTFPQVIVKGELVGGLDIVREMVGSGEFEELLSS